MRQKILIFLTLVCAASALRSQQKLIEIRGVYGHPQKLWDKGHRLDSLGVNAVFLHSSDISTALIRKARSEGAKVFAEFATLNGKGYVEKHPAAWAIDSSGKKVEAATWFMGVCPTDSAFRKYRTDALNELLNKFQLDGVWMDYVHWHAQFEDPEPILPETCFCSRCTRLFANEKNVTLQGSAIKDRANFILTKHDSLWRQWRAEVILSWVKEFRQRVKEKDDRMLLGLYHSPWDDKDFDNARYRILGLDYKLLDKEVDVFSPMVYHQRMGRTPEWVKENTEWFSTVVNNSKIWPIVQAYNDPGVVSPSVFESVLRFGLSGNATGVMMFTTSAVADDPAKIAVMKKLYRSL